MDELEQRIRAANPSPVQRNSTLSARAERDLALIVSKPNTTHLVTGRWRGRHTIIAATVSVTLVIVLAVVSAIILTPTRAMAAPPLLSPAPISGSVGSVLERLSMTARALGSPSSSVITAETWSANITIKNGHAARFVQPSEVVRTRNRDLSGEVVTYAGDVRWGTVPPGKDVPSAGSILDHERYDAGSYPLLYASAPPASTESLATYFARYAGTKPDSSSGDYFRSIVDLRNEWALSGAQTAAILDFIRHLPSVAVAGKVTDRLGRPGVAVQTETRGGGAFRDLLIFDEGTGALISAEQVYLGGLSDIDLDYPSVLDYTAWKESP